MARRGLIPTALVSFNYRKMERPNAPGGIGDLLLISGMSAHGVQQLRDARPLSRQGDRLALAGFVREAPAELRAALHQELSPVARYNLENCWPLHDYDERATLFALLSAGDR